MLQVLVDRATQSPELYRMPVIADVRPSPPPSSLESMSQLPGADQPCVLVERAAVDGADSQRLSATMANSSPRRVARRSSCSQCTYSP